MISDIHSPKVFSRFYSELIYSWGKLFSLYQWKGLSLLKNVWESITAKNCLTVFLLSVVSKIFLKLVNNRLVYHTYIEYSYITLSLNSLLMHGNSKSWLQRFKLSYKTLWTGPSIRLLISMQEKSNLFHLAILTTVVLVMWRQMGLSWRKTILFNARIVLIF